MEVENIIVQDQLNFKSQKQIQQILGQNEMIQLSLKVGKINDYNKTQFRNLLITNAGIYNFKGKSLQRKILISKISGITSSLTSPEFVIHFKDDEYDYRFTSENKERIFDYLIYNYGTYNENRPVPFYYKNDKELKEFVSDKKKIKQGISKKPTENPILKDKSQVVERIIKQNRNSVSNSNYKIMPSVHLQQQELKFQQSSSLANSGKELNLSNLSNSNNNDQNAKNNINQAIHLQKKKYLESVSMYESVCFLGKGAIAHILLVRKIITNELFVMKAISIDNIRKKIGDVKIHPKKEKLDNPFLSHLEGFIQTPNHYIFLVQFNQGGDLFQLLKQIRILEEQQAQFFFIEISLGLSSLHSKGYIYRDLKPENILISNQGHVKLTGFGLCWLMQSKNADNIFLGTPEYLAPEIIKGEEHSQSTDWWCLGMTLYEMLYGIPAFYNENENVMFQLILEAQILFPESFNVSQPCIEFIQRLLDKNPETRLGSQGLQQIKNDPWFRDINWGNYLALQVEAPIMPNINPLDITCNFDNQFTSQDHLEIFNEICK